MSDPALLGALLRAAADGDRTGVREAVQAEPSLIDRPGPHPFWGGEPTALIVAAEWGRTDVVRDLLVAGADPDGAAARYDGWTPILCAIAKGYPEPVRLLLDSGATVDAWTAAALGDSARLARLLADDPDLVHTPGPNRATPLHFAASVDVASLLVDGGARLDAVDQYGSTPARTAAYRGAGHRPVARYLTDRAGDPDIFIMIALGDAERVSDLLDGEPALLRACDEALGPAATRGSTPLHLAAALGETAIASMLLDRGVDPDTVTAEGHTALHCAARNGHIDVIRLLLDRGATADIAEPEDETTAEDWANFFGQDEAESLLREWRGG